MKQKNKSNLGYSKGRFYAGKMLAGGAILWTNKRGEAPTNACRICHKWFVDPFATYICGQCSKQ